MRREQRLRKRHEFAAVYRQGRVLSNQYLAVRVLPGPQPGSRFGFAAGKSLGTAVARNRLKRRLREAARALPVRRGWDIVIVGRKPALDAEFRSLQQALAAALRRAGVLEEPGA